MSGLPEILKISKTNRHSYHLHSEKDTAQCWSYAPTAVKFWMPICRSLGIDDSGTNGKKIKQRVRAYLDTLPKDKFPIILKDCLRLPVAPPQQQVRVCAATCGGGERCSAMVPDNRTYCSRWHNKLEYLTLRSKNCRARDDTMGEFLCASLLTEANQSNPLQPKLPDFAPPPIQKFDSNNALLQFYAPYLDILISVLGVPVSGKHNVKRRDQRKRARQVAAALTPAHKILRLMDGHCGFLLMLMEEIVHAHGVDYLNSLTIQLVDIVDRVTQWHGLMYPCDSLKCLTQDIVDEGIVRHLDETFIYMNFCGIAVSFNHVCAFLKRHPIQCMLSFSTGRRAAKDTEARLIGHTAHAACRWTVRKVPTNRNDFATYRVGLKVAAGQKVVASKLAFNYFNYSQDTIVRCDAEC